MSKKTFLSALILTALGAGLAAAQPIPDSVTFRNYFGSMTFNRPLLFTQYPGEDSVHIVLQQNGRILTVQRQGGNWVKTDSAAISVLNGTSGGSEQGLLGFAFHPNFTANRKYYVYYITGSGSGTTVVAERTAILGRPASVDPQTTVLRMTQPFNNHNAGTIGFGPSDDYLYISLGDGGSGGDPGNRAQNLDTLFGKILRLDVDGADAYPGDTTRNYAIPADNPFYGMPGRKYEIWAYGLRNPFKWSFHPLTGALWVGDVGQDRYEEITTAPKGGNLGWKIREGAFCFNASSCTSTGLTTPAITMARSQAVSITGGAVFTGDPSSAYQGVYIFGDYVTNHVWAMRPTPAGSLTDSTRIGQVFNVVSFDRDSRGRVFATSLSNSSGISSNNGVVFVLESPDMVVGPVGVRGGDRRSLIRKPIRTADLIRNPSAYEVRGLNGRAMRGAFAGALTGTFWVREKGSDFAPQLVTVVR